MDSKELVATAAHEAGHAVCGWVLGLRVAGVSVDPMPVWRDDWRKTGAMKVGTDGLTRWNLVRATAWAQRVEFADIHIVESRPAQTKLFAIVLGGGFAGQAIATRTGDGWHGDYQALERLVGVDRAPAAWRSATLRATEILLANKAEFLRLTVRLAQQFPPGSGIYHVGAREVADMLRPCTVKRTERRLLRAGAR